MEGAGASRTEITRAESVPASRLDRAGWRALGLAALLLLTGLGRTDLWAPDEPRYAAVAEELRSLRHGAPGVALLHLNDEVYTQKPPLYFWAAALVGAPGGRVTEAAARLPSALSGLACVWLAIRFGGRIFGAASGALAGGILVTAFEFAHRARRAQLDVMLTLFELIAMVAFWRLQGAGRTRARDIALLHAALGLAVLTKGPVGLLVPVLAMATHLAAERRTGELRRLSPPWALLLSIGPGLVWLASLVALAPSGFFHEAIVVNLFERFFEGSSHARPFYYFLYQFPLSFLPWTLVWPTVAWCYVRRVRSPGADPERRRAWRFLLIWIGVTFAFFSLSDGKRGLYLLPAFPAAALLCADALRETLRRAHGVPRWLRRSLTLTALAGRNDSGCEESGLARLHGVAAFVLSLELVLFTLAFPVLDPEKSPRPIAASAAALTRQGEPIGLAYRRTLIGGLRYYASRPIVPLDRVEDVRRFFASGGRVVVVPSRHIESIAGVAPVAVRARFRRGDRTILVIAAADAEARSSDRSSTAPAAPQQQIPGRSEVEASRRTSEPRPQEEDRREVGDR